MKKKIILGIITMLIVTSLSYATVTFTDVTPDYWAYSYIDTTSEIGIINGFPDGTFMPASPVTKEQALTMIYRSMQAAGTLKSTDDFTQEYMESLTQNQIGEWAYAYVAYALKQGIISTEDLNTFVEGETGLPASREEVAVWASKALDKAGAPAYMIPYKDKDDITQNHLSHIDMMYRHGIMIGDENNNFRPNSTITRAEFAAVCSRVYNLGAQTDIEIEKEGITIAGEIQDIKDNHIFIIDEQEQEKELIISPNTGIIVNGTLGTLKGIKDNTEAIIAFNNAVDNQNILIWTKELICEGFIQQVEPLSNDQYKLTIQNKLNEQVSYLLDETADLLDKKGKQISISDLTLNENVLYTCDGIKILEVQIQN
ncbi:MAG: S-layer homology domain-containing protein [Clostridia bacterium]|nr:S-layer homology domain-containing protein [Clostridia bacterium]